MERCFIGVVQEQDAIVPKAAHNFDLKKDINNWRISRNIINRVINQGHSIIASDDQENSNDISEKSGSQHIRSVICVPFGLKGKCEGIIYIDNTRASSVFSQSDLELVACLSHYVKIAMRNADHVSLLVIENEKYKIKYKKLLDDLLTAHGLVGRSPAFLEAYDKLKRAAKSEDDILLFSEPGCGMELFAMAAHRMSYRSENPLIHLNLSSISENMLRFELLGQEKGSLGGKYPGKIGRLEQADSGTLFLDGIADISIKNQAYLLRPLERGSFFRIGGCQPVESEFRLIFGAHKDLGEMFRRGLMIPEFYYRINRSIDIRIPPLRERREDIPLLVDHFLNCHQTKAAFASEAMACLQDHSWPGNIPELNAIIQRLTAEPVLREIGPDETKRAMNSFWYKPFPWLSADNFPKLDHIIQQAEKEYIVLALKLSMNKKELARKMLGMNKYKFYDRLNKYNLTNKSCKESHRMK